MRYRRIIIGLLVSVSILMGIGCASFGTYAKNRGNDLMDMFKVNAGVGFGLDADVKATDLCHLGAGYGAWFADIGFNGRELVLGRVHSNGHFPFSQFEGLSRGNLEGLLMLHNHIENKSSHEYENTCHCCISPLILSSHEVFRPEKPKKPLYRRFDLEAGATYGIIGARAGFSPGECFDFILGIFAIDFAKDDKKPDTKKTKK